MEKIGIIAGNGQFPIIFARAAKEKGFSVFAVGYMNEAQPELEQYAQEFKWLHLGQVKKLLKFFKAHQVEQAVMMGAIRKTRIFSDVKPDIKAISLVAGMRHTHDDALLRAFADLLEKEKIKIRSATFLLPELLAAKGVWTKRKPNRGEKKDIALGWKIAKEIGGLDIGQCVVVSGGSVLAVEAIDGTDATLKRGGKLGDGNACAVKVCKPIQDTRFDIPAIGVDTISVMKASGIRALAVEAGKAVVFDRDEMIELADRVGIAIIALED